MRHVASLFKELWVFFSYEMTREKGRERAENLGPSERNLTIR